MITNIKDFQAKWVNRKFKCEETGEEFTIPSNVNFRQFFKVGNGFIDVGDGFYSRRGGKVVEIKGD